MMAGTNGLNHHHERTSKYVHAEKANVRNWYLVAVIWLQLVLICIWFTQSNKQLSEMKTAKAEISTRQEQSLTFLPAVALPSTNVYKESECEPLSQCQKDCDWEPTFGKVDYHQHQPGSKHVLVTGGAGFIGSHATLRLLRDGHSVTIVDNLSRGNRGAIDALMKQAHSGQLRFIEIDLANRYALNMLFLTSDIDIVIHFAAIAYVGESYKDPLMYYENVTANTMHLLYAMKLGNVRSLVYSSTCATYGNAREQPITENTPQNPVSPYGQSKLACEKMIIEYNAAYPDFDAVILRYFNVIGSDPDGIVGEFPQRDISQKYGRISGACFDAALGYREGLTIMGTTHDTPDGTCVRDYIHVVDLVDAHVKAFSLLNGYGEVSTFNVGVGKGYSVKEFVSACKEVTGVNITVKHGETRAGDAAAVYADPTKIRAVLGWEPKYTDLTASLRTAWNWMKVHPKGYPKALPNGS